MVIIPGVVRAFTAISGTASPPLFTTIALVLLRATFAGNAANIRCFASSGFIACSGFIFELLI
jgi:hypothetical protein